MNPALRRRLPRLIAALLAAAPLAAAVGCAHVVAGSADYAPETPGAGLPLVKVAELPSLLLSPADITAVMKSPFDTTAVYATVSAVPKDTLSDPKCAGAISAGAEPMYRGSGYQRVTGLGMKGPQDGMVDEAAAAFGDAGQAQRFVETNVDRWRDCVGRILTITLPDQPPVNWVASGPNISYGVHVLLRRQEGGQGYACSHAIAARSNVVADVAACSYDDDDINDRAATIAGAILSKIRG